MKGNITDCGNLSPATYLKRHLYVDYMKNSPNLTVKRQARHLPYICTQWQRRTPLGSQQCSRSEKCTQKPLHTHKGGQSKLKAPSAPEGDAETWVTHTLLV